MAALTSKDIVAASASILGGHIINRSLITNKDFFLNDHKTLCIAIYFDRGLVRFSYEFFSAEINQGRKLFKGGNY